MFHIVGQSHKAYVFHGISLSLLITLGWPHLSCDHTQLSVYHFESVGGPYRDLVIVASAAPERELQTCLTSSAYTLSEILVPALAWIATGFQEVWLVEVVNLKFSAKWCLC